MNQRWFAVYRKTILTKLKLNRHNPVVINKNLLLYYNSERQPPRLAAALVFERLALVLHVAKA